MTPRYSSALLAAYVDEFLRESDRLSREGHGPRSYQHDIARDVLPGHHAPVHFNRLLKGVRCLTRQHVADTIEACRTALSLQVDGEREQDKDVHILAFERRVCRSLHLPSQGSVTPSEFLIDRIADNLRTPEDLRFADLIEWRDGTMGFVTQLPALQRRSLAFLEELVPQIAHRGDDASRIRLLHIAISLAMLNHPGQKGHERAIRLASQAGEYAQLSRLCVSTSPSDDIAAAGARLITQLHWLRVLPTLDSPSNYMKYLLRQVSLPMAVWSTVEPHISLAADYACRYARIAPQSPDALKKRCSVVSMKARLMAATGQPSLIREADRLHDQSREGVEQLFEPYGLLYPIVRALATHDRRGAIAACEQARDVSLRFTNNSSQRAFSALLVQLTALGGSPPLADREAQTLAREAVESESLRYQFSHVFDATQVCKHLGRFGARNVL